MIDVACALEYLLHGYSKTRVHCDLTNVLLDESMTAYIGDFGIAKILVGQNSSTLTATLGTTRYIVVCNVLRGEEIKHDAKGLKQGASASYHLQTTVFFPNQRCCSHTASEFISLEEDVEDVEG
ncbi:hypothetical protein EJ110_NYTH56888 [Nymphaea thermarum]|nr:hypothetical protein EJ110_NYTH56888 [Nymphaea thermarum]